jgi:hypothetical protein
MVKFVTGFRAVVRPVGGGRRTSCSDSGGGSIKLPLASVDFVVGSSRTCMRIDANTYTGNTIKSVTDTEHAAAVVVGKVMAVDAVTS